MKVINYQSTEKWDNEKRCYPDCPDCHGQGADRNRCPFCWGRRIDELTAQRDDLRDALIAIRDEFDGKCWEWCDTRQLTVPAEFQVHGMPRFVAREALRRLEGESKQAHGSDHVEDSSR